MKIISRRGREKRVIELTQTQVDELYRCASDPVYFIDNYFNVRSTLGPELLILHKYQERYVRHMFHEQMSAVVMPRGSGMTTVGTAFMLWDALFHNGGQYVIALKDVHQVNRVHEVLTYALNEVPDFLKPKVTRINKRAIDLGNQSKILLVTASGQALQGLPITRIFVDSFAYVPVAEQQRIWAVLVTRMMYIPNTVKITLASVPNGKNDWFASIWKDSIANVGLFKPLKLTVNDVPHYNQSFQTITRQIIGDAAYRQEFECEFE